MQGLQHEQHAQHNQQKEQQQQTEQTEDAIKLDSPRKGYYDDMQATYSRGVEELARLAGVGNKDGGAGVANQDAAAGRGGSQRRQLHGVVVGGGSLTETVGKVQRAKTVAMEFE